MRYCCSSSLTLFLWQSTNILSALRTFLRFYRISKQNKMFTRILQQGFFLTATCCRREWRRVDAEHGSSLAIYYAVARIGIYVGNKFVDFKGFGKMWATRLHIRALHMNNVLAARTTITYPRLLEFVLNRISSLRKKNHFHFIVSIFCYCYCEQASSSFVRTIRFVGKFTYYTLIIISACSLHFTHLNRCQNKLAFSLRFGKENNSLIS